MITVTFQTEINLTNEQIDDLLSIAFEGGINYWCCEARPTFVWDCKLHDTISDNGEFSYQMIDAETRKPFSPEYDAVPLTPESLTSGIRRYLNTIGSAPSDLEDIDAEIADQIIQYAVFDDIVFS